MRKSQATESLNQGSSEISPVPAPRHWFSLIGEYSRIVTVCLLHLFLTKILALILCIVGAEIMLQN
ncbi:MAG: hypothetical protein U9N60_09005, partial [Thermodesulfobacteriota bacterium]|nr:hypothetical protein [Thermodesulfobacteriota bacterium]